MTAAPTGEGGDKYEDDEHMKTMVISFMLPD